MAASLAGGVIATLLLVPAEPLVLVVFATADGPAAGIGFAPVFGESAPLRPDAPGASVGYVNTLGNAVTVVRTPLLGLAFSLPGNGRVGFAAAALLWAAPLLVLVPRARSRPPELSTAPRRD
jgi:hypothetical protein